MWQFIQQIFKIVYSKCCLLTWRETDPALDVLHLGKPSFSPHLDMALTGILVNLSDQTNLKCLSPHSPWIPPLSRAA